MAGREAASPAATVPCANCGSTATGLYCADCGQRTDDINRPFRSLLLHAAEETFGVEGRVWRSLRLLVRWPGALTAEYLAGRRARHTAPLRLYLMASAAYFIAFRLTRGMDQAYYGYAGTTGADYFDTLARVFILLLPALAIILAGVYADARRPFIQHVVLSLHLGAAALLWATLLTAIAFALRAAWGHHSAAPAWLPDFVFWLHMPGAVLFVGYVVIALRRTYGSTWPGAIVRAAVAATAVIAAFWQLLPLIARLQGS